MENTKTLYKYNVGQVVLVAVNDASSVEATITDRKRLEANGSEAYVVLTRGEDPRSITVGWHRIIETLPSKSVAEQLKPPAFALDMVVTLLLDATCDYNGLQGQITVVGTITGLKRFACTNELMYSINVDGTMLEDVTEDLMMRAH